MTTVQDIPRTTAAETGIRPEARKAVLDQAVAELMGQGWRKEKKHDYERVLVGHNGFRVAMVRRRWGIHDRRILVDVDRQGEVSTRPI